MKVGIGYDIHRLKEGRKLILGGVEIPYKKGLEGHSDADVLLHAICDALLGAVSEYDIGTHFPDTDPQYCGISSLVLLKKVMLIVQKKGGKINNIDSVVIAEEPKIAPFVNKMKDSISSALNMDRGNISVKASTNEGIGAIGSGDAIASYAVATIV